MTFLDKDYNEKCYRFFTKYGVVSNNMYYSGKLTYSCEKKDSEYDVSFLTLKKNNRTYGSNTRDWYRPFIRSSERLPCAPFHKCCLS